jgi:hypothetical protein
MNDAIWFVGGAAVIVILLDLWALASLWRSDKSSTVKAGWTALIVIFPVIGLVIWGVAGPRGIAIPPSSPEHSKG